MSKLPIIIGFLMSLYTSSYSQDVIGCGGFIKSDVEINFSLIEVKLLSKQGALKYQTDCAPINGYYMIPVYDKGEYSLVVEAPPGWSFEPQRVEVNIDGSTDKCSKGEDINFHFIGFGITGRVVSVGQSKGPGGVTLELKKKASAEIVKSVESLGDGSYLFSQILPGDYTIDASHPTWLLEPASTDVTVDKETGNAGSVITVLGYDVTGRVLSEMEPTKGVKFMLYSNDIKKISSKACDVKDVANLPALNGAKPLCHTTSSQSGYFVFRALPCGTYNLVPIYQGENIKFDVVPSQLPFQVNHESLKLSQNFQVAGFSVSGKVVVKSKGEGVVGATVKVNDRQTTTTADGRFLLDTMKAGTYAIQASAKGMYFDPVQVKITPNTPELPEIVASRFAICGSVKIDTFPERVSSDLSKRKVSVAEKADKSKVKPLSLNAEGRFCTDLAPGVFVFKAEVTAHEIRAGLMLTPPEMEVTVSHNAADVVHFKQLRVRVTGSIRCVETCKPLQLSLESMERPHEKQLAPVVVKDKNANFVFKDIMPGKYKVAILNEDWCWDEKSVSVNVLDKDVTDVTFTHNGYVLSCSLSHDITLNFAHDSSKQNAGSFKMSKGVSKFCLEKPGVYTLYPQSCHKFEQDMYKFDTANPSVLALHAVNHLVEGKITTLTADKDIKVLIKSSLNEEVTVLGPLQHNQDDVTNGTDKKPAVKGPFEWRFTYWAKTGEVLEIKPTSEKLLFYPEVKSGSVDGSTCPGMVAEFDGKQGVFIEGEITPPLSEVAISITTKTGESKIDVITDSKGKYKVGPLHPGMNYNVNAVKEGYVLTQVQNKRGHFTALKLGEITVKVVDESGTSLQGVLLSLSGVEYRNNVLTPEDGTMLVNSLSPGQYFIKPMMKEYVFDPVSQTVNVQEGGNVRIDVIGKRVAYSCHGVVTSLNGEHEQGVLIEALGQGSPQCATLQEEGKTEQDGSFHIRGLQPHCEYKVQLKSGDYNTHIERSAPEYVTVQVQNNDVSGVRIIAFRRMSRLDLSGNLKCSRDHLQYLKVSLYNENAPDSPLHTVNVGQSTFFHLPSLTIDNERYFIKLESTLSRSMYDYTLPEVTFTANKTFQHFTITFNPIRKSLDQELSPSSFLIVPLTLLLVFLSYNYTSLLPYLSETLQALYQSLPMSKSSAGGSTSHVHYDVSKDLLAELTTKKKKPKRA